MTIHITHYGINQYKIAHTYYPAERSNSFLLTQAGLEKYSHPLTWEMILLAGEHKVTPNIYINW